MAFGRFKLLNFTERLIKTTGAFDFVHISKFSTVHELKNCLDLGACSDIHVPAYANTGFGAPYSPSSNHIKCLQTKFRLNNFKPVQWTIINSILEENLDNFVIMPTGYGKSLCYQFPAVYTNGISVIISPLISLMQDQVNSLKALNIPACFLGPAQSDELTVQKLLRGCFRVVYLTPETALSNYGIKILKKLHEEINISLLAIDEAHCILQWGDNFRPAYGKLDILRKLFPSVPILALTATATNEQKYGIINLLGLRNPNEINAGLDRRNLFYLVRGRSKEPYGDISRVLLEDKEKFSIEDGSVIIYTLTRKSAEKISNILNKMNIKCQCYHSGMNNEFRRNVMNDFMNGKIKIIVATTSFGLGINNPDVRIIIHYGTPLSMEGYYQEVGRGGRDGKPALCVLYYSLADFTTHRYLNSLNSKTDSCYQYTEMRNLMMKKFAFLTSCRRKFILDYFDDSFSELTPPCYPCCDNCSSNSAKSNYFHDLTEDIDLLLSSIHSLHPKTLGINTIISLLLGSTNKHKIKHYKDNKFFGTGIKRSEDWWKQLSVLLEIEKYIKFASVAVGPSVYTKVSLDFKGKKWIQQKTDGFITPIKLKLTKNLQNLLKENPNS